jgi:hypothetical protein
MSDVHPATPLGSPPATGTAPTPGRAACDAFWAAIGAGPDGEQPPDAAWNWAHEANACAAWEAAAQAAITRGTGRILAQAHRYRAERDEARAQLSELQADLSHTMAEHGADVTRLQAELATCREHNAGIAVQLDQYRNERDEALAGYIDTAERDEYQLVIQEIAAEYPDLLTADWRNRAGLGPS